MAVHHGRKSTKNDKTNLNEEEEEEEDPYDLRIKDTGCAEFHHALQECFIETGDWRKCQKQMQEFKECMAKKSKKPG